MWEGIGRRTVAKNRRSGKVLSIAPRISFTHEQPSLAHAENEANRPAAKFGSTVDPVYDYFPGFNSDLHDGINPRLGGQRSALCIVPGQSLKRHYEVAFSSQPENRVVSLCEFRIRSQAFGSFLHRGARPEPLQTVATQGALHNFVPRDRERIKHPFPEEGRKRRLPEIDHRGHGPNLAYAGSPLQSHSTSRRSSELCFAHSSTRAVRQASEGVAGGTPDLPMSTSRTAW